MLDNIYDLINKRQTETYFFKKDFNIYFFFEKELHNAQYIKSKINKTTNTKLFLSI